MNKAEWIVIIGSYIALTGVSVLGVSCLIKMFKMAANEIKENYEGEIKRLNEIIDSLLKR